MAREQQRSSTHAYRKRGRVSLPPGIHAAITGSMPTHPPGYPALQASSMQRVPSTSFSHPEAAMSLSMFGAESGDDGTSERMAWFQRFSSGLASRTNSRVSPLVSLSGVRMSLGGDASGSGTGLAGVRTSWAGNQSLANSPFAGRASGSPWGRVSWGGSVVGTPGAGTSVSTPTRATSEGGTGGPMGTQPAVRAQSSPMNFTIAETHEEGAEH